MPVVLDAGIARHVPRHFTGEDALELQGHGGPVVMDLPPARSLRAGRAACPARRILERAFLNEQARWLEAEAIADLIASDTALRSLQGGMAPWSRA